jgi:hypothetical protein
MVTPHWTSSSHSPQHVEVQMSKHVPRGGLFEPVVTNHVPTGLREPLVSKHVPMRGLYEHLVPKHVPRGGLCEPLESMHVTRGGLYEQLVPKHAPRGGLIEPFVKKHVPRGGLCEPLKGQCHEIFDRRILYDTPEAFAKTNIGSQFL